MNSRLPKHKIFVTRSCCCTLVRYLDLLKTFTIFKQHLPPPITISKMIVCILKLLLVVFSSWWMITISKTEKWCWAKGKFYWAPCKPWKNTFLTFFPNYYKNIYNTSWFFFASFTSSKTINKCFLNRNWSKKNIPIGDSIISTLHVFKIDFG